MNRIKRLSALCLTLALTLSIAACGGDGKKEESSKKEDVVKVVTTNDIDPIPEGAESTLLYMGIDDLNPVGSAEKSVGLTLFEDKGGKIKWTRVTAQNQATKLGAALTAGKDVPDIFKGGAFPYQVVQGFFQSVDEIVDFNEPLWIDVKATADQSVLNGKHYCVPLKFEAAAMIFYDKNVITENGFDDPMELYYNDQWDYDAMDELMEEYVKGAEGDEVRYGINGYYAPQYVQQTGETLVKTDDYITYKNNLDNPKLAAAEDRLANWQKQGWVEPSWIGSAGEAFKKNILFYSMGAWAATGSGSGPTNTDNWGVVPMPKDPTYEGDLPISSATTTQYMWVKGSTKKEAVKTFYECYRIAVTDPGYQQNTKDKWLEDNPNWSEEAYQIMADAADPNKCLMIFDPAYGVSSLMSNDFSGFMTGVSLANWLYKSTSAPDEQGVSWTWTQIKEKHSPTVDAELKTLNENIKKFIESDK